MRRLWLFGIAAAAVVTVVSLAVREAWVCDDALISFRYVRNLVAGNGLVFNAGERVEGFSNALFIALLAPLQAIGANLFDAAIALGIAATAVEVVLLIWLLDRRGAPRFAIAVAAALFATDRITVVWATGGLEVGLHGALVTGLLALQLERPRAVGKLAVLHAVVAASRPEAVIFFPIWIAHLAIARRTADLRRALNIFVPLIVALLAARFLYYGALAANPYRAKVAGVPTLEFGVGYALWFLRRIGAFGLPVLALLPLVACAVRARREASPLRAAILLALAFVVAQLVAVVAMGGDYMGDFRFFRPIMGPLYIAVGGAIGLAWQRAPRLATVLATVAFLGGHAYRQLDPVPIFDDAPAPAEHKRILTIDPDKAFAFAAALARFAVPGDAVLADWAGYMAYGHELRTIDATGLVSTHLERDFYLRPLRAETGARERLPGHARWPTTELLQRERFAFIFPKVNDLPPERAEVDATKTQRTRDYPFLHVTVPLPDGRYLRFFTTLGADQIAARARDKQVRACWRPAFGALTCVDPAR